MAKNQGELKKLGYNCVVLEARDRIGGRCWSVRRGDKHAESNNKDQISNFDSGLYFNAGPSRIPHHHQLTMQYCKELGVPLEVYNNINQAAFFYSESNGALTNKKLDLNWRKGLEKFKSWYLRHLENSIG